MTETSESDYHGTVTLNDEGEFTLPEEFENVNRVVIRTPWATKTFNEKQGSFEFDATPNDHLVEGEIEFKARGETHRYRVEETDE